MKNIFFIFIGIIISLEANSCACIEYKNQDKIKKLTVDLDRSYTHAMDLIHGKNHKNEGVEYLINTAKLGHKAAAYQLGVWSENGTNGFKKDIKTAIRWYTYAMKNGSGHSANHLGCIFEFGVEGVPQNYQNALNCYKKGGELGYIIARRNYKDLKNFLISKDINKIYKKNEPTISMIEKTG